jgi:muconolactone D-isomerase
VKFLVTMEIAEPPADTRSELLTKEAERASELAAQGHLIKLWRIQGRWANAGIWSASGAEELNSVLDSLPLRPWMTVSVSALEPHPSDPERTEAAQE